jgi:hypothetical protein
MISNSQHEFRRGDTRKDGKIFWAYSKNLKSGEHWVSPEKFSELQDRVKQRRIQNADAFRVYDRTWKKKRYAESEDFRKACAQRKKKYQLDPLYREKNNQRSTEWLRAKLLTDATYRLKQRVRGLVSYALRRKGVRKESKAEKILGCSFQEFQTWITEQFLPGMTIENYGDKWHVDHYIPVESGRTEEEIVAINHYTNLRPMWSDENLRKKDKLPFGPLPENLKTLY